MKRLPYFIFGFSVILLLTSIAFSLLYRPLETREVFASVEITEDTGGFDLNGSALTFGKITRGSSVVRNLLITNGYSFPVLIKIDSKGNITEFLSYQESYNVDSGESISIPFSIFAKEDSELGPYLGIVKVKLYQAKEENI